MEGLAHPVRSETIQSGSAALISSNEWLVSTARTLAPAALPLLIPAGASSTTRPMHGVTHEPPLPLKNYLHFEASTPHFLAPARYGSGLQWGP